MDALQQQKLDAMKELAYGASHEINNPLANIAVRAQTLLRDEEHPERRRALESIHQQAMRAHEMISDLMLFARPPQLERGLVDLESVLEAIQRDFAEESARRNIRLAVNVPGEAIEFYGDRQQLEAALKALVENAIEAVGRDGSVEITLDTSEARSNEGTVSIAVADTGPGISAEVRRHMFDPFYSGREAGRGLGFGLSKCWRIASEHGGTVAVESDLNGATLSLQLPVGKAEVKETI